MKKLVGFIVLGVLVFVGAIYLVVSQVMSSLQIAVPLDGFKINNPIASGDYLQGVITGSIVLNLTNNSAWTITLDSLYLQLFMQDGTPLGTIDEPLQVAINGRATTTVTLQFEITIAGAIDAIWSVIKGGVNVNIIGYASYMKIFRVPINQSIGLKTK